MSLAGLVGCGGGQKTPGGVLSVSTLTFPSTLVGASSAAQTLTLTNNGSGSTTVTGIAVSGTGFASTNNCGTTLAAGALCTITVQFAPTAVGNFTGTLTVTDNAPSMSTVAASTVALSGTGVTPVASLSPASLTFPSTNVGVTSSALSATVTNSGTAPLVITAVSVGAGFALSANTCVTTVAVGGSCSVSVTFSPTSAVPYVSAITFTDSALNTPQAIALTGTGTTPGVSFSSSTLAFPATVVGSTATAMSTTLTNTGSGPLNITGVTLGGTNPTDFTLTGTTCTGTIAAGGSCTVTATFTPVGAASYNATITVTDNGSGGSQGILLTGTGLIPGGTLSPTTLAFPNTVYGAVPSTLSVTVTSSGQSPLTFGATATITGTGVGSFSILANTCLAGSTLAVGSTCKITVAFAPIAVASFGATLNIFDNVINSSGSVPQTVALSGTGTLVPSPNSCKTQNTTSPAQPTPTSNYAATAFTGSVKAGGTGVIGAKVQVYAAGTTGNGSAPTALLATPLTTDTNGNFSVATSFTCPLSNSVLYAVATGGQVGSSGPVNAGISLMTVMGVCSKLTSGANYTINEATTVTSAFAMSQFLATGAKMGASATNAGGLALAAGTAANLVNLTTGTMPGTYFPATGTAPVAKIGSVANMLNACAVGSATSTACTGLYAATTLGTATPTNTLDAAMNLAKQPGTNVATLFTLSGGSSAYASLQTAPSDWMLYVTVSGGGMNDPTAVTIDSTGLVWVLNYFDITSLFNNTGAPVFAGGVLPGYTHESYGGAVNVSDVLWAADEQTAYSQNAGNGGITVMNNAGTFLGIYLAGGIYFPTGVAFDPSGLGWVTAYGDTQAGVVLLNSAGVPLTGYPVGYGSSQFNFPVAVATDSLCNGFLANQSSNTITKVSGDGSAFTSFAVGNGPSGIAVDQGGNAWSANYYDDSVGLMSVGGPVLSSAGFKGGGVAHPQGIAIDGGGSVWVANYRGPGLSELAGATSSKPGTPLSPTAGWGADANMIESFGLAIDAGGNVWVSNFGTNTLTEFVGVAVPVKTPLLGAVRQP